MTDTMYGAICSDYPGSETWQGEFDSKWVEPTLYLLRFEVIELRKDAAFRPAGVCYVAVVFRSLVPVPSLALLPEHLLYWGGDASIDAGLSEMLPFTTGPYHGVRELGSDRLVGHGAFFCTREEAEARAKRGSGANVENLI